MAAQTEPRSGLQHSAPLGEANWDTWMNANLLRLGRFAFHLSVKDRDLTTPPGSPVDGDTYIVAAAPTGAWAGKAGQVAVWNAIGGEWVFGVPRVGWTAYLEDEQKLTVFKAGGWSAGIAI